VRLRDSPIVSEPCYSRSPRLARLVTLSRRSDSGTIAWRRYTLPVLCPTSFIATGRNTPARSNFRTAVLRRSGGMRPSKAVRNVPARHASRRDAVGNYQLVDCNPAEHVASRIRGGDGDSQKPADPVSKAIGEPSPRQMKCISSGRSEIICPKASHRECYKETTGRRTET
jgi:hypothetical protein